MPQNDKGRNRSSNQLVQRALDIRDMLGGLSRRTYYSVTDPKNALEVIRRDADEAIDNIINTSVDMNGTHISNLYSRLNMKKGEDAEVAKALEDMFEDRAAIDGIMTTYMENKYIKNMDLEIDTILKYMPQLKEALESKKDSILSSDSFSKDFINIQGVTSVDNESELNLQTEEIKDTYGIIELFDDAYDNIATYGEDFIYTVPYSKAISRLMQMRDLASGGTIKMESYRDASTEEFKIEIPIIESASDGKASDPIETGFKVNFNKAGVIDSILESSYSIIKERTKDNKNTVSAHGQEVEFSFDSFSSSPDGVVEAKDKDIKLDITGCVVKRLKRENVIPLYIDEMCIGYYYIETTNDDMFDYVESKHDPFNNLKKSSIALKKQQTDIKDETIKNLAREISEKIDGQFVNANQDLTKEIYLILKHNNLVNDNNAANMTVSFIPPGEIHHLYFKKDPKTNRGISDLAGSFIPAKLFTAIYISNVIGILTRSHDKRAYFVKQFVDTNISQNLISVINQIKKSNFGRRELDNLDNVFNIAGRFNDYVIPVTQGGERPIEFEVISGQDIDTKDDLMEKLEDMAVKTLGVPKELLDSNEAVDFATRLVMANAKFLRHVLKRQSKLQIMYSNVFTTIFNYHFDKNEKLEVILPPPSHLNLNNINEMWSNASSFVESLIEMEVSDKERDESESFEAVFRKNLMRYYLATYINWNMIDSIKAKSKLEATIQDKAPGNDDDGGY